MCSADSPGRSTSNTEPVLIFDLDGTILSVNSFPYWARAMLLGSPPLVVLRAAHILARRKLLGETHAVTKRRLQHLWTQTSNQRTLNELLESLQRFVRPNLKPLLAAKTDAILATAAAGEYAEPFGRSLGFSHILTTPLCTDSDTLENCKERKRDRVLATIAALGWNERPRIFLTDHEEDLPLIKECQRTLWFGDVSKIASVKSQAPGAEIIACRDLSAAEITQLISNRRSP